MWFKKDKPKESINEVLFQKIKSILVKQLKIDIKKINLESRIINDFGADSLDAIELVMEIEEEFGIEIPDEDVEKMVTVEDIVKYIQAIIVRTNRSENESSERNNSKEYNSINERKKGY